jgi:hypothetical protein
VCPNKSNIDTLRSWVKSKFCYQPILISGDIENNTFITDIICGIEHLYHLLNREKTIGIDHIIPKSQGGLCIWMLFTKIFQSFLSDYPHGTNIENIPNSGKQYSVNYTFCPRKAILLLTHFVIIKVDSIKGLWNIAHGKRHLKPLLCPK